MGVWLVWDPHVSEASLLQLEKIILRARLVFWQIGADDNALPVW